MDSSSGTSEATNHLYTMDSRQDQKNSLDIVMSMIRVFALDFYVLMDHDSSLSFLFPYVAGRFDRTSECLLEPFSMFTHVGDSILAKRVYMVCSVSIYHRDTMANLVELGMVDFDMFLGMDLLYVYYAFVNYRTLTVKFKFLNEPVLE